MSTIKANKFQTLDGLTYCVPIQVVTSSLGASDLGTTASSTSDRTNNNASYVIASNTTTWTDTSNLQLSITPKFSNSLIKLGLAVHMNTPGSGNAPAIRVIRGSTIVFRPSLNTTGPYSMGYTASGGDSHMHYFFEFYDRPNTTSTVTYSLQYRSYSSATTARFFGYNTSNDYSTANYFTATEIAQ